MCLCTHKLFKFIATKTILPFCKRGKNFGTRFFKELDFLEKMNFYKIRKKERNDAEKKN